MRAPPNCQHLDNYRHCRVHKMPWVIRIVFPNARPSCIIDRDFPPRDNEWICGDQLPYPRPASPPPAPRKK
jgi:hypothetical protein